MRIRHASARLIRTFAYFRMSFSTDSSSLASLKATGTARRPSSALSADAPAVPRRWKASDKTASHVAQGGAGRGVCATAQGVWESRRLSSATTKPASRSTFPAIARGLQVVLLAGAQIGRQAVHRADEIRDSSERHSRSLRWSDGMLQPLANDIRL